MRWLLIVFLLSSVSTGVHASKSPFLEILRTPDAFEFDFDCPEAIPIQEIQFGEAALRDTLIKYGALTLRYVFPGFHPEDIYSEDINGDPVILIDLSNFFRIEFPSIEMAEIAIGPLLRTAGIRYVEMISMEPVPVMDPPNDPPPHDPSVEETSWGRIKSIHR
jgi:hypothetical protein